MLLFAILGVKSVVASGSGAPSDASVLTPTVTAVSPDTGPVGGGTTVTVSGTGFVGGETTVDFGTTSATDVSVISATALTAVVPAGAPGSVDVTVGLSNQGGLSSLTSPDDLFAYGEPTVTKISPGTVSVVGGSIVTVTGTGFVQGAQVSFGAVPAPGVEVTSATTLTVPIPTRLTGGTFFVTVTTPGFFGGTSATSRAGLLDHEVLAINGVEPSAGPMTGGQDVIVGGTGFVPGTTVHFGNATSPSVKVLEGGTGLVAVSPPGLAGPVNITVTTPTGASSAVWAGDTYVYGAPTVTAIDAASGAITGGTVVTVTGSGFVPGCRVTFGLFAATSVTVNSPTSLTAVTPAANAGVIPVRVSTTGGLSPVTASGQFTYTG